MKKLISVIILLTVFICFSYRYLKNTIDEKKTFIFRLSSKPLIYCKKKLELDDQESFEFDEYFRILSNSKYQYKYSFDDENILISLNNDKFSYPYLIKEKEKEIVTEYVIKEVYVNNAVSTNSNSTPEEISYHSPEGMNQSYEYEAEYLNLLNSVLYFEKGSDISDIINAIQGSIDTNVRISVDYSSLNPNDEGEYPVFIYSDKGNDQITVKIT